MQMPCVTEPERIRPITIEEWAELPEDEEGEFVDGFLVEEEEMGVVHDVVQYVLGVMLAAYVDSRSGFVATSESTKFAVSKRRGRKPDLWIYFDGRKPSLDNLVRVPPDIMVEVVTDRPRDQKRDRVDKVFEYAAFGVRWYWLVEPTLRSFEVLELGTDGRYAFALAATNGKVEHIPGCPGLVIDLNALWAKLDQLAAP